MMFVKSMIGIFVPVYLYSLGYSIVEILLYNVGFSIFYLLLIPHSVELINNFGFKKTLVLSIFIYMFHLTTLNYLTTDPLFFHLAWISFGFYVAVFWPVFHSEVATSGNNSKRTSQIGTLQVITILVGSFAPLIGGLYLEIFGYWQLLIFSTILLIFGLLPLLLSEDIKLKNYSFYYPRYLDFIKTKKYRASKIAFSSEGVELILSMFLWPIILFILFDKNFLYLGFLFTVISFISAVLILYVKKYIDRRNKKSLLILVSNLFSFSWTLRVLSTVFFGAFIFIAESIFKLVSSMYQLSFMSIFYNNSKNGIFMDYIIFRELYFQGTKIIFCMFVIVLLLIFGEKWELMIALLLIGIIIPFGLRRLQEE